MGRSTLLARENIYESVINLYQTKSETIFKENPFYIEFRDERAIDMGGVTRDMFSAFFDAVYVNMFAVMYPAVHPSVDINNHWSNIFPRIFNMRNAS